MRRKTGGCWDGESCTPKVAQKIKEELAEKGSTIWVKKGLQKSTCR